MQGSVLIFPRSPARGVRGNMLKRDGIELKSHYFFWFAIHMADRMGMHNINISDSGFFEFNPVKKLPVNLMYIFCKNQTRNSGFRYR